MKLALKNPLAFFDLETTGLDIAKDRIVEIAVMKIDPAGNKENFHEMLNPTIPIDPGATAIHGISDKDVEDAPTFVQIARQLVHFIEGCDLAGYNCNRFDLPLLAEEFLRADVDIDLKNRKVVDVQVIFHKMEQRTLAAAYQFYCNKELVDAHSAGADTEATFEVLEAQLDRYGLKNDVDFLSGYTSWSRFADYAGRIIYNDKKEEVFNFGKYKGQKVSDILKKDPSYYAWMMNGDFPLYTKKILTRIKIRTAQE